MGQRDVKGRDLEAWEFRDPADVAERRELLVNALMARKLEEQREALAKRAEQQRIHDLVFKKAGNR